MEKKVMELCEMARIGAGAAVMSEGKAEEAWTSWCIDSLDQLNNSNITCPLLVSTQLVKHLLPLTNHPRKKIQDCASDLIVTWRSMLNFEDSNSQFEKKKNENFLLNSFDLDKSEQTRDQTKENYTILGNIEPANIETSIDKSVDKWTSEEHQEISEVGMVKVQKVGQDLTPSSSKGLKSESVSAEITNSTDINVDFDNLIREERKASGIILQKLSSSMIRCNDCFREVVREKVCDALSKVCGEAGEEIRKEVDACDSVRVAIALESAMFEKWGRSDGRYQIKYRAVLGNLRDPKNPDFRRRVLIGQVKPETVVNMTAKEMATAGEI